MSNYDIKISKPVITLLCADKKMEEDVTITFTGESTGEEPTLQEKSVTPTEAAQEITADTGYDGLSKVNVDAIPSEYVIPSGSVDITENGTHDVSGKASVNVNIPSEELNLQEKTATPTKSEQEITPDSTYNGLGKVVVEAIPSNYIEPSGTVELTTLGEHDVTQYAKANVNVPASAFEDSIYSELNEMTFGEGE